MEVPRCHCLWMHTSCCVRPSAQNIMPSPITQKGASNCVRIKRTASCLVHESRIDVDTNRHNIMRDTNTHNIMRVCIYIYSTLVHYACGSSFDTYTVASAFSSDWRWHDILDGRTQQLVCIHKQWHQGTSITTLRFAPADAQHHPAVCTN